MKVYILSGRRGRFVDRHAWVVGVFSTREAAEAAEAQLKERRNDFDAIWEEPMRYAIEEFILDQHD